MIKWLLLVSLFCKSTQDGTGQENGFLQCGPQNLNLTTSDQMILLTWQDDPSCSAVHDGLVYELLVFKADKQLHHGEFAVMPDQIGSTHSWKWTSHLPLACASHSVRLRSRYNNHTSPWKQESTPPGVFPRDRMFKVGSTVTFCCILPAGDTFNNMHLTGYSDSDMTTTKISNQTYTVTVHLNQSSGGSCTDVVCQTSQRIQGACAYIGYPPGDKDIQCETRNLQSVECHWTVGRDTRLSVKSPTLYHLLGSECINGSKGTCEMEVQVDAGERNWTVTAQNHLGKVELSDSADLIKRVHMFAPKGMVASTVNARNVTLEWGWTVQQYNNLNIKCQVKVIDGETNTISEHFGVGLHFAVLNDLIPHWTYNATVRCGTTEHFWNWSDWSTSVNFLTKGDVPDALDVWMQVKSNETIIIWKMPLANQSHGHIKDYEVTCTKTTEREQQNTTKVHNKHRHSLSLDTTEEHIVTVTARNINGSSSPTTITIPSLNLVRTEKVNTSRIIGSNGSFSLSWSASPAASCGYIVDWCPTSGHCEVEWLKVAPNETSVTIFSKKFIDGVQYSLSVYAGTQGAPVLLERREGYVSEKRIENDLFKSLKWKQQDSDVEVSWDPINPKEQSAFIQGYVLYCFGINNNIVITVSTDKPKATSLTARKLNSGSYTFTVKAQTAVGECGTTSITATVNSLTDNLVRPVFISLVTVFSLLSLITILCYRYWACIKHKVYPPIPKPVLTDKWLTSPGENSNRPLCVDQCHHNEADIVDTSELHCNSVALENGYVSQENMLFVFSQTPVGSYNQPLKKSIPPSLTLPSTSVPSQSGLSSSSFTSVFPNLSYNLIIQTGDQRSSSGPELQEVTSLERSSSGYQPQSNIETFSVNQTTEDPESPMSCVSTYILLPQSPSK